MKDFILFVGRYFGLWVVIESFLGGVYGVVDIFDIFFGDVSDYLFVLRVDGWECFFGCGVYEFVVD